MSLQVKLNLGEHFLNWYPANTKLYIRGQRGKGWSEQRALDREFFDQFQDFLERYGVSATYSERDRLRAFVQDLVDEPYECATELLQRAKALLEEQLK